MEMINSDSEVVDITEARDGSSASSSGVHINIGAVAFVSILALAVIAVIFARDAQSDARHSRELLDMQRDYWKSSFDQSIAQQRRTEKAAELTAVEYRVLLNHYMELESQLKEIRHERR